MKETNFPGCGKLFASMDITAVRRANFFWPNQNPRVVNYQVSLIC